MTSSLRRSSITSSKALYTQRNKFHAVPCRMMFVKFLSATSRSCPSVHYRPARSLQICLQWQTSIHRRGIFWSYSSCTGQVSGRGLNMSLRRALSHSCNSTLPIGFHWCIFNRVVACRQFVKYGLQNLHCTEQVVFPRCGEF